MMPGASGAEVKVSADTEYCDQITSQWVWFESVVLTHLSLGV